MARRERTPRHLDVDVEGAVPFRSYPDHRGTVGFRIRIDLEVIFIVEEQVNIVTAPITDCDDSVVHAPVKSDGMRNFSIVIQAANEGLLDKFILSQPQRGTNA